MNKISNFQGIDTDLHGTPAFLQAASVDPDHQKHIEADLEEKCIQTNISGQLAATEIYQLPRKF